MMKMRCFNRVLAFVAAFALTFFACGTSGSAASYSDGDCVILDYKGFSRFDDAVSYLQMLGVVSDCDAQQTVTRGQALCYIVRCLGYEDAAMQMDSMYTYEEKFAAIAHNLGILASATPSEWDLDSPTDLNQISKMLVVALGYGITVEGTNTYPAGYLNAAASLGLMKGTADAASGDMAMSNFIIMLTNAMDTKIMEYASFNSNGAEYRVSRNKTLEDVYLEINNLRLSEGIVEADYYDSIIPGEPCDKSYIRIGGNTYSCETDAYRDFVSCEVEFVYTDTSGATSEKIQGMRRTTANRIYQFANSRDAYFKNGNLYYAAENGKEGKIAFSSDAVYVVNHKLLSSYALEKLDFDNCTIRAIDNNNDRKCDVIFITKSESMIVNYVKDDLIYTKFGALYSQSVIDLSNPEDTRLIIRDMDGAPKLLSDISADSSISVIASDDLRYIEIILLPEAFEGRITAYSSDKNTVVVNDTVYSLKISAEEFTVGNTYRIRINEKSEIFYIESIMSGCSYLVAKQMQGSTFSDEVAIKVYDSETGIQIFYAADRVNIGGISYRGGEAIYNALAVDTLAYVTLSRNNRITKVEYLNEYGQNAKRIYRQYAGGFNDMVLAESMPFRFNEDTAFFYIPENRADEDFSAKFNLKNEEEYLTHAFEYDENTGFVKAVVVEIDTDMRSDNYLTYKSDVGVVSGVWKTLDDEGQPVWVVEGFTDGEPFTCYGGQYSDVTGVCGELKTGDVIRYIANYNDVIVRIQKIVSLHDVDEFFHDGRDTTDEQFYGRSITLKKNVLTNYSEYLCHEMNVSTSLGYSDLTFMRFYADVKNPRNSSSEFAAYYCYDRRRDMVTLAGIDDIITYEQAGDSASKLFVQRSKSNVQCIVIVKD